MKTGYKRISLPDRILIEKLWALGQTQAQIGLAIGCHKTSVGGDLKQCKKNVYSALEATRISVGKTSNRRSRKCKIISQEALGKLVLEMLGFRWSPEQIHLHLKKEYPNKPAMQISMESIYFYI